MLKSMTNSQELFSIALGLEFPWQIRSVSFDKDTSQLGLADFPNHST